MALNTPPQKPLKDAANPDPYMASYLASLNLEGLNLSHLEELEQPASERRWLVVAAFAFVLSLSLVIWMPSTSFYLLSPLASPLYFALIALTLALGIGTLPALLRLRSTLGSGGLARHQRHKLPNLPGLPTWLRLPTLSPRTQLLLMMGAASSLIALVVFVLPREVEWTGRGYGNHWFLAVGAALCAGILVGRVIMASAEARPLKEKPEPFVWPGWVRWATLAALVGTGIVVLILGYTNGDDPYEQQFSLAGVGLLVGILGAIWLARRFEDLEEKYRKEARQKAILRGD